MAGRFFTAGATWEATHTHVKKESLLGGRNTGHGANSHGLDGDLGLSVLYLEIAQVSRSPCLSGSPDSAEEVKCFVISQEEYTHTPSESRGGLSTSPPVLLNPSLGLGSESKAAPHLTFSQVTSARACESAHSNVAVSPSVTSRSWSPRTMVTGASGSGRRRAHLDTGVTDGHIETR